MRKSLICRRANGVAAIATGFLLVSLVVGLVACVSDGVKPLSPQPIDTYALRETSDEVTMAAESLAAKEKTEAAFGIDLTKKGFAPILLVLESRSGDNMLLLRDEIELVDGRGNLHKPVSALLMAEKLAGETNTNVRSDWMSKGWPSEKTLSPDQRAHGVLYFEMGPALPTLPKAALYVPFKNLRTAERHAVFLRIHPPERP